MFELADNGFRCWETGSDLLKSKYFDEFFTTDSHSDVQTNIEKIIGIFKKM